MNLNCPKVSFFVRDWNNFKTYGLTLSIDSTIQDIKNNLENFGISLSNRAFFQHGFYIDDNRSIKELKINNYDTLQLKFTIGKFICFEDGSLQNRLERVAQLQKEPVKKLLIPLVMKVAAHMSSFPNKVGNYRDSKINSLEITLDNSAPYAQDSSINQHGVLVALLGVRDAFQMIRPLKERIGRTGSHSFSFFNDLIKMHQNRLKVSLDNTKAVVYVFKFSGCTFNDHNSSVELSGNASDSKTFGNLNLTFLQYLDGSDVVYQIFEAKNGSHALQSNHFARYNNHFKIGSTYSIEELQQILSDLQLIAGAETWTTKEENAWNKLTGEKFPEWLNQKTTHWSDNHQGFRFFYTHTWIDLNNKTLPTLECERGSLDVYSYKDTKDNSNNWNFEATTSTPEWPATLYNLAARSTEITANVFRKLHEIMRKPKKQIMPRAGEYCIIMEGYPLDVKYKIVTTKKNILTNCGAFGIAIERFFRSRLTAQPESRISPLEFNQNLYEKFDIGEMKVLHFSPYVIPARLYSFSIANCTVVSATNSKIEHIYGGHNFNILQFVNTNHEVRYLMLDAYQNEWQGLERLSTKNVKDPSWSRQELDVFLGNLCTIANATHWTLEVDQCYFDNFGVHHTEFLGYHFRNAKTLNVCANIYPVCLNEVFLRNESDKGEIACNSLVQSIEVLSYDDFLARREKEWPGTYRGWWMTKA